MRTTVDIPDPTYRELKSKAASEGCSVKQIILRGVLKELDRNSPKKSKRIRLPIVKSKEPGVLHLTNDMIYDLVPFP